MATGPIGRTLLVGGVRPLRDGERSGEREGTGASTRTRDAGRSAGPDGADRVTISPDAVRGARGREDDPGTGDPRSGTGAGTDTSVAESAGFRNGGEALLLARGLANALLADPDRAVRMHDLVSPLRATSLLRG